MSDGVIVEQWIGAALKALTAKPSQENLSHLAECYIDAAAYYAVARRWVECYDCLKCAELTSISSENIVNKVITLCVNCRNVIENSEIVDALFDLVANVNFDGNNTLRKQVFGAFHWFSRFWDAYLDFCEWWGFENFDITDFQVIDKRDSLAESAYIAYSRRVLPLTVAEYTFDFYIDFIEKMLAHHFTVYAEYHVCRFMIKTGFDVQDVLRGYRRYIKQKSAKSWSWISLSHLFDEDSVEYQACTMFAQECERKSEDDSRTLDYRAVCHQLFADLKDADAVFWRNVQARMREMQDNSWTERKRKKKGAKKEILYKRNK